jgi:hypothetical protein
MNLVRWKLLLLDFVPQLFSTLALLSVLSMVTWKRKVQIQDEQARITLPKRWVEEQGIQDKDKLEIKQMKRESALKLKLPE